MSFFINAIRRRWRAIRLIEKYRVDGWEPPLDTEHFARDPQYPIEKLDQKFRQHEHGDPTL